MHPEFESRNCPAGKLTVPQNNYQLTSLYVQLSLFNLLKLTVKISVANDPDTRPSTYLKSTESVPYKFCVTYVRDKLHQSS